LGAEYGWVTLGASGAMGQRGTKQLVVPAMTVHVKDTVGAGDAYYSLAVLSAVNGVSLDIATFLANIAGAIKSNVVGNAQSVNKVNFLKYVSTVLNV